MIKSGHYIVITNGNDLVGLMNRKTNKVYKPKKPLYVTYQKGGGNSEGNIKRSLKKPFKSVYGRVRVDLFVD